jgi:hypothetical protein
MSDFCADLETEDLTVHVRHPSKAKVSTPRPITVDEDRGEYVELCKKCNGTGRWLGGYNRNGERKCFACKGEGKFVRRTSPEQRAKAKQRYAEAKATKEADRLSAAKAWAAEHPEQAAWIKESRLNGFEFAQAMHDALLKFGGLTEKQQATVDRLTAQSQERKARWAEEKAKKEATAPLIRMDKIEEAFRSALSEGKTTGLKLRLDSFAFSPAPSRGANAGAIYVKENGVYLGKIAGGKFLATRDCSADTAKRVIKIAADPKAAAIAYGRRTGNCACCGRLLTAEGSVELGIGPICAEKWGF